MHRFSAGSRSDQRPTAQHFGHAPRLSNAAAGRIRRFGVENFADRTDASLVKMSHEAFEECANRVAIVRMSAMPRVNQWADQPSPDGSLMIGRVACPQVAVVFWHVVRVTGGQ